MSSRAEEFSRIFAGLARSSGRYVVPTGAIADPKTGKIVGRPWTSKRPVGLKEWEDHLSGVIATVKDEKTDEPVTGPVGLGIVPIREDGTAVFGAIDVDVYPLTIEKFRAKVAELGLPLIVCRTKSSGAHAYLFLSSPARATLVREKLIAWAIALGHPGVEIFPKQDVLTPESDGSWINIPYAGGNRSLRYALGPNDEALSVDEFIEEVRRRAISPETLEKIEVATPPDLPPPGEDLFPGAPPCLRTLWATNGWGDWGNNSLFDIGIYLKKRGEEDVEAALIDYNDRLGLGVPSADIRSVVKSVKKKNYFYKCKDGPISGVCNKTACAKVDFGLGGEPLDPGVKFGTLAKVLTEPPVWVIEVDGELLEVTTDALTDQRKFRTFVIERLNKWPNPVKPSAWEKIVRDLLASATTIVVPDDGTREGQFFAHLAAFCTGRARARLLEEIILGKAFTDHAKKRVYFRSTDFFAYLTAHRFAGINDRDAWRWLRKRGVDSHASDIKGKRVDYWSVPAFPEQTEEHAVPRGAAAVEM